MLTVTLKNTEQNYLAKLAIDSQAQVFEVRNAKQLNSESSGVLNQAKHMKKSVEMNTAAPEPNKEKVTSFNWTLVTVILLHVILISTFFSSKADKVKVIEPLKTMTVSLLSESPKTTELVLQRQVTVTQKQKNEKSATSANHDLIKTETASKTTKAEAEVDSQQATQAIESKLVSSEITESMTKVEHVEKITSHEKVTEDTIEQPKFDVAYLNNPAPTYPKMSRRQGEQGRVLLKVLVSENGIAEQVQLDTSSGFEKLDEAAIDAVKKWSFVPAKKSNQAISAYVLVPVKFSLNS